MRCFKNGQQQNIVGFDCKHNELYLLIEKDFNVP